MPKSLLKLFITGVLAVIPCLLMAQPIKILINHIGYENNQAKTAIVEATTKLALQNFEIIETETGKVVYTGKTIYSGPVDKWKQFQFWTISFTDFNINGNYQLQLILPGKIIVSYPFMIGKNVLEQFTLSDVIYYFKGQRCSGLFNQADRHILLSGKTTDTIDAHGGWYDATGDYGKHLSHLSFSSYFNPQQISLTAWGLLKTYELLNKKPGTDFRQYKRHVLDEAVYGADYLVRMQVKNGSFYRSVGAPGPGKFAKDRVI